VAAGSCKDDNEPASSVKEGTFVEYFGYCNLLSKNYLEGYSSIRRTERVINLGQIYGGLRLPKLFTLVAVYTI
jgi:hypothetical protein